MTAGARPGDDQVAVVLPKQVFETALESAPPPARRSTSCPPPAGPDHNAVPGPTVGVLGAPVFSQRETEQLVQFQEVIETVGKSIDAGGVAIVVVGVLVASALSLVQLLRRTPGAYESYRRLLGRSILLGLEFLVAADIIRTVAVTPTFRSVGVLAVIVVIRTFLSFSLELEITGRWPWQKQSHPGDEA